MIDELNSNKLEQRNGKNMKNVKLYKLIILIVHKRSDSLNLFEFTFKVEYLSNLIVPIYIS